MCHDGEDLMQIEAIILQEELMCDYFEQRFFELISVNGRDETLAMQVLQQS